MDEVELFFAGTGGSAPSARRALPALLARLDGDRVLFDCGEGTQRQLLRSVGLADLDAVFLTHHHADHWLGLPGMLKTFDLRGREKPLDIFGPPGTGRLLGAMSGVWGRVGYELAIVELEPGDAIEFDGYEVECFNVRHRGRAFGYAIAEDERPGRFDVDAARALGVPPGPAFGRLQAGEAVDGVSPDQVIGPPRPGRRIVLSGDTAPCEMVRTAARGADVLVHEATFLEEDAQRAALTEHSTARQAAQVAADAGVRLLALSHLSSRYPPSRVRDEARAVFEPVVVPRDFDAIDVPHVEKGEPRLVPWDRAARVPEAASELL
ncbi:MAG: ribonuclease Z [Solirubrobacteraceae bacterium]|nr:ribonuclease Z [Solirubrobacteraceae bacterium]